MPWEKSRLLMLPLSGLRRSLRVFERKGLVAPAFSRSVGERTQPTFAALRDYYLGDASVKAAIDNLVAQIVGGGFYVDAADEKSVHVLEKFNEEARIVQWFQYACTELLYAGNHFLEYPEDWRTPGRLIDSVVELSSIVRIRRDEFGRPLAYVQVVGGREQELDPDRILHLAWNIVDRRGFGTGLLSPLVETRVDAEGDTVPPLLDIKAQMENDLRRVMHRYPPRYIITFPNLSDEKFEQKVKALVERAKPGEDFATNTQVDFKELTVSSRADYAGLLTYFNNQVNLALETPFMRLMLEPSSLADARVVMEAWEPFRLLYQEFLKHAYEDFVAPRVLGSHGLFSERRKISLHWGQPDQPNLTIEDLHKAFELGGISHDEYRVNLQRFGVMLSEASEPRAVSASPRVGGTEEMAQVIAK